MEELNFLCLKLKNTSREIGSLSILDRYKFENNMLYNITQLMDYKISHTEL